MSTIAQSEQTPRAVPLADLSTIDTALRQSDDALREALKSVRSADVGRDLSRRSVEQGRRLLRAADDRSAPMMLRSANPASAAQLLVRDYRDRGALALDL